uniref:Uncharacterized protein n=1 Tax=Caenorhabditis japonica TaxID=281687 RepID=A0A8R1IGW8_CAEJA
MAPSPMPQFFAPTYFPQQPTLFPVMNDSARYAHQTPESCSPAAELPSVSVSKPSPPPTKPSKAARKRPAAEPIDIKGGSGKNQRDESPLKCLERMVPVNVVSPNIYSETDCGRFNLNQ